ncbi:MAG: sensor domain-containing diguanylate cyclase [Bacteriovoracaceae bacterium]
MSTTTIDPNYVSKLESIINCADSFAKISGEDSVIKKIISEYQKIVGAQQALLFYPESQDTLKLIDENKNSIYLNDRFSVTDPFFMEIFKCGNITFFNDISDVPMDLSILKIELINSIIFTPLFRRATFLGMLVGINNENKGEFNKMDNDLARSYAVIAAIYLDQLFLQQFAFTDSLTGAYTRKYFNASSPVEFARIKRNKRDCSVAMLDIDHFKKINDGFGHQAGDFVLSVLGKKVLELMKQGNLFIRYGGEEFLVLMPETNAEAAKLFADGIRKTVEKMDFVFEGKKIPVTLSSGVCDITLAGGIEVVPSLSELIKKADVALYFSKHNGRNQVNTYSKEQESVLK